MSDEQPVATTPPELSGLLGRDYWLILSTPEAGTSQADVDACAPEHIAWLLTLERDGVLFLSGPLLSGPGTGPGSGVTILRAADEDEAGSIAAEDPFAVKGLRTFTVHRWRLNEGSIGIRLSLGTATYDWR
ncbi:MAG TPA: YciI family protein [Streptosporangiaceae bacterium]